MTIYENSLTIKINNFILKVLYFLLNFGGVYQPKKRFTKIWIKDGNQQNIYHLLTKLL